MLDAVIVTVRFREWAQGTDYSLNCQPGHIRRAGPWWATSCSPCRSKPPGANQTNRRDKIMAIRNFYIDADIDGRRTGLSGGPASKTGGLSATILVRHEGTILRAVQIWAHAKEDGTLTLMVTPTAEAADAVGVKDEAGGFTIETRR
jgi:hypothetical protein